MQLTTTVPVLLPTTVLTVKILLVLFFPVRMEGIVPSTVLLINAVALLHIQEPTARLLRALPILA